MQSLSERILQFRNDFEMSKRMLCPYCTLEVNLKFTMINRDVQNHVILRQAKCPDCFRLIIECGEQKKSFKDTPTERGVKLEIIENPIEFKIVFPFERKICIDERIPKDLRDGLNEAYSIIELSFRGAAAITRATLETFLVKHINVNIEKKNLHEKIEAVDWTKYGQPEVCHAIRMCGNYGLHVEKDAVVTQKEAVFAILKLKELFELHFIKLSEDAHILSQIQTKDAKTRK